MVKSGMVPAHIKTPEAAIVVMRYGHQLGIDDFTAMQNMFVVGGKPSAFASLLHSLILRDHGGDAIRIEESTATVTRLSCKRRDGTHRTTITYTIEEARAAGLKDGNWAKYPTDMLFARCISRAGRQIFRDSTMGLYTPEEIGGTIIEAEGEVIETGMSSPNPNRLANLHRIGQTRGLDHEALQRIAIRKLGKDLGDRGLTATMLSDLEATIEGATDDELRDWSFDWFTAIENAVSFGAAALDEVGRQIKEAGISQKTHPSIAEAFQAAKRRLDELPTEAQYREVEGLQVDPSSGEIVDAPSEKPKKAPPVFGQDPPPPADRHTK